MSQAKMDRNFPVNLRAVSDVELANIIARALREDFGDTPSSIKRIGQITSANLRAIKNWYEAKNMPSSRHLLILSRSSPGLLRFILMQIGGEELWDVFQLFSGKDRRSRLDASHRLSGGNDNPENVTLNVTLNIQNERQSWFLEQIDQHIPVTATSLSKHWAVTLRTARRDISGLKELGRIRFRGPKRSGIYEAVRPT